MTPLATYTAQTLGVLSGGTSFRAATWPSANWGRVQLPL